MRTTKQMREAPFGAFYVWPVFRSIQYAERLARAIGRPDLRIIAPSRLHALRGQRIPGLVLDHACATHMTSEERYHAECLLESLPVPIVERPAKELGWVRRVDLGPRMWELPDGRLYQAQDDQVPVIPTAPYRLLKE